MKRTFLIAWAFLRLPALALVLFLFRIQAVEFVEETFGLESVVDFAVFFVGAFGTRALLYAGGAAALWLAHQLARKLAKTESGGQLLSVAAAGVVVYVSFAFLLLVPNAWARALAVSAIFAVNTLPADWLSKRTNSKPIGAFFLAGIGIVEALVPQAYVIWLWRKTRGGDAPLSRSWLAGVLVAPLFWVFLFTPHDNQRILTLGEKLHPDPAVEKFANGNFNWLEFNPARRELYAVGFGSNFLLAYDVDHLNVPPRKSAQDIGKTQSFAFNPDLQEIYVYKNDTGELLTLDAAELKTLRAAPMPDMAAGDVWVAWNRLTDSVIVSSETDIADGESFVMLDRQSAEIVATLSPPVIPTAFILFHPSEPILYFNSFRDTYLAAWDMEEHRIVRQTETSPRTDRLAYAPDQSELLVVSPLEGAVLRYDAETLEFKGKIKTALGDRTIAIDVKRNLILVGNFVDNRVRAVDLQTHEVVASFYLGPWIRTIALDTENGVAYVSTIRHLFKVTYAAP